MTIARVAVVATTQPPEMSIITWPLDDERTKQALLNDNEYLWSGIKEFIVHLENEMVILVEKNIVRTDKAYYAALYSEQLNDMKVMDLDSQISKN